MLRSAVGKTHVLRSGLVMDYTTSYLPLIVMRYPLDSKRSYGPLSDFSRHWGHVVSLDQSLIKSTANKDWLLQVPTYGSTCALAVVFQLRSLYIP